MLLSAVPVMYKTRSREIAVGQVQRDLSERDRGAHRHDGFYAGGLEGEVAGQYLSGKIGKVDRPPDCHSACIVLPYEP